MAEISDGAAKAGDADIFLNWLSSPSQAELSGAHPFLDMERSNPAFSMRLIPKASAEAHAGAARPDKL